MDPTDLIPLIEQLDDNIDELEDVLSPLLQKDISDIAGKLPLLDKAQLYVLAAFAIESLLFSYLRLNDVNAKEHPIFGELARVKQYFAKITGAENGGSKRTSTLAKPAAGRFIKHALAGNAEFDRNNAQRQAEQELPSHIKFEQTSGKRKHALTVDSPALSNSSTAPGHDRVKSAIKDFGEQGSLDSATRQVREGSNETTQRKKKRKSMPHEDKRPK